MFHAFFFLQESTKRPTRSASSGDQNICGKYRMEHPLHSNNLKVEGLLKERNVLRSSEEYEEDSL